MVSPGAEGTGLALKQCSMYGEPGDLSSSPGDTNVGDNEDEEN